jgi:1-phosphofructokinase
MVLTGAVHGSKFPPEFYRNLALDLGDNGVTVIADLWGPELRALAGGIDFLKVSHLELIESGYCVDSTRSSILRALADLSATCARNIIVSCAEAPALSLIDGQAFEIVPPKFQPLDFRGAGDFAVRPIFRPPAVRFFRLAHDAGLAAPS